MPIGVQVRVPLPKLDVSILSWLDTDAFYSLPFRTNVTHTVVTAAANLDRDFTHHPAMQSSEIVLLTLGVSHTHTHIHKCRHPYTRMNHVQVLASEQLDWLIQKYLGHHITRLSEMTLTSKECCTTLFPLNWPAQFSLTWGQSWQDPTVTAFRSPSSPYVNQLPSSWPLSSRSPLIQQLNNVYLFLYWQYSGHPTALNTRTANTSHNP